MDAEREHLSKLKKSTKSLCESANTHYKNECHFAEALFQLGNIQDVNQDPQICKIYTNFATLLRALANLSYERLFGNFFSKNFLSTIKTVLNEDVGTLKNDAKKSFEKALRDYEVKYNKAMQREKRQSMLLPSDSASLSGLTNIGSLLTLEDLTNHPVASSMSTSSMNTVQLELSEEKRALQLALSETSLIENELRSKREVNVLCQLLEMYHVLRRFFCEGLETVDQFANFIDTFSVQLQQRRQQLSDERKELNELRARLLSNDYNNGYVLPRSVPVPPSLLPEMYNITTTVILPDNPACAASTQQLPASASSHSMTYEQQQLHQQHNNLSNKNNAVIPSSNSSPGSLTAATTTTANTTTTSTNNTEYSLHQPHGDKRCGTQRQGYLMMKKLDSSSSLISQSLKIPLLAKRFTKRFVCVQNGLMLIVTDPSHVAEAAASSTINPTINSNNSDSHNNHHHQTTTTKKGNFSQRHKSTIRLQLITCQAKPIVHAPASTTTSSNAAAVAAVAGAAETEEQCSFDVVSPRSGTLRFIAPSIAERDIWLSVVRNSQQEALQVAFSAAADDDDDDGDEDGHSTILNENNSNNHNETHHHAADANSEDAVDADNTEQQQQQHDSQLNMSTNSNITAARPMLKKPRLLPAVKRFVLNELESNSFCCDCGAPANAAAAARINNSASFDSSKDVSWISTNFGIVLCIECSGIHRNLGVHVSRVQSLTLDRLSPAELLIAYALGGNCYFNQIFEAKLSPSSESDQSYADIKPNSSTSMEKKRAFIEQKYLHRAFIKNFRNSLPPSTDNVNDNDADYRRAVADMLTTSFNAKNNAALQTFLNNNASETTKKPYAVVDNDINLMPLIVAYTAGIDLSGRYFDNEQTLLHVLMRDSDDIACLPLVEFIVQNAAASASAAAPANNLPNSSSGQHTGSFSRPDADDNTPVHLAALHDRSESLKLLLRAGADWRAVNKRGRTACEVAVEAGNQRCADMLNETEIGSQYYSTFSNVNYSWNLVQPQQRPRQQQQVRSKSNVSSSSTAAADSGVNSLTTTTNDRTVSQQHNRAAATQQSVPPQSNMKNGVIFHPKKKKRGDELDAGDNDDGDDVVDDDNIDDELVIVDADHFNRDHVAVIGDRTQQSKDESPSNSLKPQRQLNVPPATTITATNSAAGGRIAFRAPPPPRLAGMGGNAGEPTTPSSSSTSLLQNALSSLKAGVRRRVSESPGRPAAVTAAAFHAVSGGASDDRPQMSNNTASSSSSSTMSSAIASSKFPTTEFTTRATTAVSATGKLDDEDDDDTVEFGEQSRRHSAPDNNSKVLNIVNSKSYNERLPKITSSSFPATAAVMPRSLSGGFAMTSSDDDYLQQHQNEQNIGQHRYMMRNGGEAPPPQLPPKLRRKARPLSMAQEDQQQQQQQHPDVIPGNSSVRPPLGTNSFSAGANNRRLPPHAYHHRSSNYHQQQSPPDIYSQPAYADHYHHHHQHSNQQHHHYNPQQYSPVRNNKQQATSGSQFSPADLKTVTLYPGSGNYSVARTVSASIEAGGSTVLPPVAQQRRPHNNVRHHQFLKTSSIDNGAVPSSSSPVVSGNTRQLLTSSRLSGSNGNMLENPNVAVAVSRQRQSYAESSAGNNNAALRYPQRGASHQQQKLSSSFDGGSGGVMLRCCALYDCAADRPDELSFRVGDIIMVTREQTQEPMWMEGFVCSKAADLTTTPSLNDMQRASAIGLFPASFVYLLPVAAANNNSNVNNGSGSAAAFQSP